MSYTNAYSIYKETSVKTASQGKLVVLLYQESLRQLEKALSFFNSKNKVAPADIEQLNKSIVKTQEIITELMVSLDMDKGGEIARNLMALYVFFTSELTNANINHDKTKLLAVQRMMSDLCSAWTVAAENTAPVGSPIQRSSIDING